MIVLITLLVLPAAGLLAWGVITVATWRRRPALEETLAPYTVGLSRQSDARAAAAADDQALFRHPALRRIIDALAEAAAERGLLALVEEHIEQADLPMRPAEALFLNIAVALVGGALALLLGNVVLGLAVLVVLALAPWAAVNLVAARRTSAFVGQLPEMLQLLATTLRSGFSILQGLDAVASQLQDPMGKEMRHVVAEARLGRPLPVALAEVAGRVKSEDFSWVVSAIAIQREVGGNLSELLDIVSDTMTARSRLRQEVRTLTAEGRIGAIVLSLLPIAIGVFVYTASRNYLTPLFHSTGGRIMFYGSVVLAAIGIVWMRRIVKIEM